VYIEYEVDMKALIYGHENTYQTLAASLQDEGIEMQKLEDDTYSPGTTRAEEQYDLAIVDIRTDNANKACRFIRENWDIPLVLIVDALQADWKGLKSIEADGYISDVKKGRELSARSKALLRRLFLKNKFPEKVPG
jgi:DNA-binding response OmpR family regulator